MWSDNHFVTIAISSNCADLACGLVPTLAERAAKENYATNAIGVECDLDVQWVFARDGALTTMDAGGVWYGGCSLPRRASAAMLKKFKTSGAVAVFLAPPFAATIEVVLGMVEPTHAIIAVFPETRDLATCLHCHDFSEAIGAGRLHFVHGADWAAQLAQLLIDQPGLAAPGYMIRVPATEAIANTLVGAAQAVVGNDAIRRSARIAELRKLPRVTKNRLAILAPTRFRLWADAGAAMISSLEGVNSLHLNTDDPRQSSPLALAQTAAENDAILSVNFARCDARELVADDLPWLSWITTPRIPAYPSESPGDGLILADPAWVEAAKKLGWPADRLAVGGWPITAPASTGDGIALIADTTAVGAPPDDLPFSSHKLLWQYIAEELAEDPLSVGNELDRYLRARMKRFSIGDEGFDSSLFIQRLIVPGYMQSIARHLLRRKIALRIHGNGWNEISGCENAIAGAIETREQMNEVIASSAQLLDCWPFIPGHPVRQQARPYVQPIGSTFSLRTIEPRIVPPFSAEIVRRLLSSGVSYLTASGLLP